MNLLKVQDSLKGASDQQLISEMQNPSGAVPSYLVLSELGRRKKMRDSVAREPDTTVADELTMPEAPQAMPPQMPPQMAQMAPQGMPQEQPQGLAQFAHGGEVRRFGNGEDVESSDSFMDWLLRWKSAAPKTDDSTAQYQSFDQGPAPPPIVRPHNMPNNFPGVTGGNWKGPLSGVWDTLQREIDAGPMVSRRPVSPEDGAWSVHPEDVSQTNPSLNLPLPPPAEPRPRVSAPPGGVPGSASGAPSGGGRAAGLESLRAASGPGAEQGMSPEFEELRKRIMEQEPNADARKKEALNNFLIQMGAGMMATKNSGFLGSVGEALTPAQAAFSKELGTIRGDTRANLQDRLSFEKERLADEYRKGNLSLEEYKANLMATVQRERTGVMAARSTRDDTVYKTGRFLQAQLNGINARRKILSDKTILTPKDKEELTSLERMSVEIQQKQLGLPGMGLYPMGDSPDNPYLNE